MWVHLLPLPGQGFWAANDLLCSRPRASGTSQSVMHGRNTTDASGSTRQPAALKGLLPGFQGGVLWVGRRDPTPALGLTMHLKTQTVGSLLGTQESNGPRGTIAPSSWHGGGENGKVSRKHPGLFRMIRATAHLPPIFGDVDGWRSLKLENVQAGVRKLFKDL